MVRAPRLLAAPLQDALVQHAHGVDDLRVARQRIGLGVGLGGVQRRPGRAGLTVARWLRTAMATAGAAGGERDEAEARMDEEHRREIERRHRRIEQHQHGRAGHEAADLVQAAQGQHVAAVAGRRGRDDAGEHRAAEDGFHSRRQPAEHLAAQGVEQRQDQDESERQQRQHDQRVEAAAGQHAVGNLEQVDRHRQHEQVDEDRENADGDEGAQRDLVPLLEGVARRCRDVRGARAFVAMAMSRPGTAATEPKMVNGRGSFAAQPRRAATALLMRSTSGAGRSNLRASIFIC